MATQRSALAAIGSTPRLWKRACDASPHSEIVASSKKLSMKALLARLKKPRYADVDVLVLSSGIIVGPSRRVRKRGGLAPAPSRRRRGSASAASSMAASRIFDLTSRGADDDDAAAVDMLRFLVCVEEGERSGRFLKLD